MQSGEKFKFICAPGRWKGEKPREPAKLLGKVGVILGGPFPDSHGRGGLYSVLADGQVFQYYGDFMETA